MNYNKLKSMQNMGSVFIAEAGINHDGNLKTAIKMIDAAVIAGADYVKFQSFRAKSLVTKNALTSSYIDKGSHQGESFQDLLARLELTKDEHYILKEYCDSHNIKFLSTAFDNLSFDLLVALGIDVVKVASGDLTNIPFLQYMAKANLPMIVSTGMGTLGEIEEAVNAIEAVGNNQIVLMHCISWYPAEISTTNLRYMSTLRNAFGYPVGYSDHTLGVNMSIAARALGAVVLEKHFTLDSTLFGPDHAASIEPKEMQDLIVGIREVEAGLGTTRREFSEKELGQRKVHRKSIVVTKNIPQGACFSWDNLELKRPGIGIEPKYLSKILGKQAKNTLYADSLLDWSDISQ